MTDTPKTMKSLITCFLFLVVMLPKLASAHFHYELKVDTQLKTNDKQQLTAIKMTWLYDNIVSKLMLQDEKDTNKLAKQIVGDLSKLQYFTSLKLNNHILETSNPSTYKLEEIKSDGGSNLQLTLTLPLKKPVSLKGKNILEINHEDATASAIMFYENPTSLHLGDTLNQYCNVDIKEKEQFEEGESPQIVKMLCSA